MAPVLGIISRNYQCNLKELLAFRQGAHKHTRFEIVHAMFSRTRFLWETLAAQRRALAQAHMRPYGPEPIWAWPMWAWPILWARAHIGKEKYKNEYKHI